MRQASRRACRSCVCHGFAVSSHASNFRCRACARNHSTGVPVRRLSFLLLALLQGCAILPGLHVDADVGDRTPQYEVVEINADTIRQTRLGLTPPAE